MLAAGLLLVAVIWGLALLRAVGPRLEPDASWVAGPILGLVSGSWILYLAGWAFGGLRTASVTAGLAALLAGTVAAHLLANRWQRPLPGPPPGWLALSTGVLGLALGALNVYGVLATAPDGVVYAVGNARADIPFHTSISTTFAHGANFPPVYPLALNEPMRYPFLVDLLTAVLDAGGLSLRGAVVTVNVVLQTGFFAGFLVLMRRLGGSVGVALLAGGVLLFLGNLGVLTVPGDIADAGGLGAWLSDLPWDYTGEALGTHGREQLGIGIYLGNPTFMFLLPRRSGAFGLAVGVIAAMFLLELLRGPPALASERTRLAVLVGIFLGLTPRVHAHTAIALAVVGAVWILGTARRTRSVQAWWRPVLVAIAVAAAVGLPQVATMAAGSEAFVELPSLGWIGEPRQALHELIVRPGIDAAMTAAWTMTAFWLLNAGFLVLVLPAALIGASPRMRSFYAGFAALWVFANVVNTQPWEWDNSSYFVWWQVATVAVVVPALAGWLTRAADRSRWRTAVAVLCLAGLTAGGMLSLVRTLQDRVRLWEGEAAEFAQAVRARTPEDAVLLTAPAHDHVIPAVSGRRVVMGFEGWLYTHGIEPARYRKWVERMYLGDIELMRQLGIRHVVVGPHERRLLTEVGSPLPEVFDDPAVFRPLVRRAVHADVWRLLELRPADRNRLQGR